MSHFCRRIGVGAAGRRFRATFDVLTKAANQTLPNRDKLADVISDGAKRVAIGRVGREHAEAMKNYAEEETLRIDAAFEKRTLEDRGAFDSDDDMLTLVKPRRPPDDDRALDQAVVDADRAALAAITGECSGSPSKYKSVRAVGTKRPMVCIEIPVWSLEKTGNSPVAGKRHALTAEVKRCRSNAVGDFAVHVPAQGKAVLLLSQGPEVADERLTCHANTKVAIPRDWF